MKTFLDLPESRARVKRWTVSEYERFTELGAFQKDVELIHGIILEKISKSPLHRYMALALYDFLKANLPPGFLVMHEAPLMLEDSMPEPDVMVVQGWKNST